MYRKRSYHFNFLGSYKHCFLYLELTLRLVFYVFTKLLQDLSENIFQN